MDNRHKTQLADQGWMNLISAADYADASLPTVRRWVKQGLLPANKLASGTWRVRRVDLEAFLQGTPSASSSKELGDA
jgi:excisionase family DNA binding protein